MKMLGKMLLGLFIVPGMTLVSGALGGALGFLTVILMGGASFKGGGGTFVSILLCFAFSVVCCLIGLIVSIRGMRRWSDQTLMVLGASNAVLLALVIVASTFASEFIG